MPQLLTEANEPINALYYGDGGTGKTSDVAAMANLGKILLVNAESGIKSRPLKRLGVAVENIELFPGPGEKISYDTLEAEWLRVREAMEKDPTAYVGFVLDSITEIYKVLLDDIVQKAVRTADRLGRERDPHFIDRSEYGVMTEQVRSLVRKFRDLPCHFAMTALARRDQDDDGSVTYQPGITPALQNDLIGWVDVVCWTTVVPISAEEEEYRGLFRPHLKYRGKDRLGALPKWLVTPTFDRIVAYAEGELDVDSDPIMQSAKEKATARKESERADASNGSGAAKAGANQTNKTPSAKE